jgi:hypothetical protein
MIRRAYGGVYDGDGLSVLEEKTGAATAAEVHGFVFS